MILTITLNPAVDEEYIVPEFRPGGFFKATSMEQSPGGKGINVSITLKQMGYDSVAMGFLAGYNGGYVRDYMRRQGITTNFVHVHGETRTNAYVIDSVGRVETGISEKGPFIPEEAFEMFLKNYERVLHHVNYVVVGGSIPPGLPDDTYKTIISMAKDRGKKVMIDANGVALEKALEASPTFAKVDHRFATKYTDAPVSTLENLIEAACKMHDKGIEWVVASYRTYGDVFSTPQGVYMAEIERHSIVSLLGAGEALVAGLIVSRLEKYSVEDSIRFAMAAAMEDSLHTGKGVRSMESIEQLLSRVKVERLE